MTIEYKAKLDIYQEIWEDAKKLWKIWFEGYDLEDYYLQNIHFLNDEAIQLNSETYSKGGDKESKNFHINVLALVSSNPEKLKKLRDEERIKEREQRLQDAAEHEEAMKAKRRQEFERLRKEFE